MHFTNCIQEGKCTSPGNFLTHYLVEDSGKPEFFTFTVGNSHFKLLYIIEQLIF